MEYERRNHEILQVTTVTTSHQTAIVRRHHTMYAHVRLTGPSQVPVGQEMTLGVRLSKWDDGETVTDYTPTLTVSADGEAVCQVDPVNGEAIVSLRFTDPGTYRITVGCPTVQPATVAIEVVDE